MDSLFWYFWRHIAMKRMIYYFPSGYLITPHPRNPQAWRYYFLNDTGKNGKIDYSGLMLYICTRLRHWSGRVVCKRPLFLYHSTQTNDLHVLTFSSASRNYTSMQRWSHIMPWYPRISGFILSSRDVLQSTNRIWACPITTLVGMTEYW